MPALHSALPDVFTLSQARKSGLTKREVYRQRDDGDFEVIGRGLFRRADADERDSELAEITARAPRGTICLSSALARYELSDEIPAVIDIAMPRGSRAPVVSAAVRWHFFDAATFEIEREQLPLKNGMSVGIFSIERCIIDAFRMRGREGHDVALTALKRWLRRPGSRPSALIELARRFPRAATPLQKTLEILL